MMTYRSPTSIHESHGFHETKRPAPYSSTTCFSRTSVRLQFSPGLLCQCINDPKSDVVPGLLIFNAWIPQSNNQTLSTCHELYHAVLQLGLDGKGSNLKKYLKRLGYSSESPPAASSPSPSSPSSPSPSSSSSSTATTRGACTITTV